MPVSLRAAAFLLVPLLGCTAPDGAMSDELGQRLRTCREELEVVVTGKHDALSDADLDLLEQAQIDADRFHPDDVAGFVVVLRFGATLRDEELPGAIEFGASEEGRMLAFPLQTLLVPRRALAAP